MDTAQRPSLIGPVLGLAWCVAVIGAYFYYNAAYYAEKLDTFLGFFARILG